jgi:hypothetical protein
MSEFDSVVEHTLERPMCGARSVASGIHGVRLEIEIAAKTPRGLETSIPKEISVGFRNQKTDREIGAKRAI